MKLHLHHDWSTWSNPIDTQTSTVKVQSRYCVVCRKAQVGKISQPWNIWFRAHEIKPPPEFKEQA